MRKICFLLLLLALGACARAAVPRATDSGIEGRALLGPVCPVIRPGIDCSDKPASVEVRVLKDGQELTRFKTGSDGRFRIALAPGTYVLEPTSGNPFPAGKPSDVTVSAGAYTHVDVHLDTGIR
jgi:hypothetical protein